MGRLWGSLGLAVCLLLVLIPTASGDWLEISGEKGFSFEYNSDATATGGFGQPFNFNQSLLLDVKGGFGDAVGLEGHLVDQPNSPAQLFLALQGNQFGLQFGDHDLSAFQTAITGWKGEFNGLDGFYQNQRHRVRAVFANPTAIGARESLVVQTGGNSGILAHRPIREGSLTVECAGVKLIEGVDYTVNYDTGEFKLLFFVSSPLELELNYQYVPGSVLGNQLFAFQEQATGPGYRLGVGYFGSQSQAPSGPFLLGENRNLPDLDLLGVNGAWERAGWKWDLEYWVSRERLGTVDWDLIDNMEGSRTESEVFPESTEPGQWSVWGNGSGMATLSAMAALQEPQHTRESRSSLVLDYHLQRTGDTVGVGHDFGAYRDFTAVSKLRCWVYQEDSGLELELAIATSENNYYSQKFRVRDVGWQCYELEMNPATLARMGAPDLQRIRYLTLGVSSPNGDERAGRLFVAPFRAEDISQAVKRWSEAVSAPGGSIEVASVAEAVPDQPVDNQVLQLEYSVPDGSWSSVSYHPSLPLNLAGYREFRLMLNTPGAVRLTWLAQRGATVYPLGQLQVATGGFWQEYSLPLAGLTAYCLERIETLTLKIDQVSGIGQLKLDAIRAAGRESETARALKGRGEYVADHCHSLVEFNQFDAGFRDWAATQSQARNELRNVTEYIQDQWRVKSDLQLYRKADPAGGLPIQGRDLALEIQRRQTMVTLGVTADAAARPESGVSGNRVDSQLGITRQTGNWNFDYRKHRVDNDLTAQTQGENDAFQVRFAQGYWLGWTRVWRDVARGAASETRQSGGNLGLSFDPPGTDRWQITGGTARTDSGAATVERAFGQSELDWGLLRWLRVNGRLQYEAQPENASGVTDDYQRILGLELLPSPAWNLNAKLQSRDWEQTAAASCQQQIREYRLDYAPNEVEKTGLDYRQETLASNSGVVLGSRMGIHSDLVLKEAWLTQVSAERNRSDSEGYLTAGGQENRKISLKNTRKQGEVSYYWGAWAEKARQTSDLMQLDRQMAQLGWELAASSKWNFGAKLELGRETAASAPESIWGLGGFATLNVPNTFWQFNLRYQTFASPRWKMGFDCRIGRGEAFAFNWHADYLLDPVAGRDLAARFDLRFYFH